MSEAKRPDIVHLTFFPPFAPGSYNKLVGTQIRRMPEFEQVAISYWAGKPPERNDLNGQVVLVDATRLSLSERTMLLLPERLRRNWLNGIGNRENLIYAAQVLKMLPHLRPKIIICYDAYKLGPLLRQVVDWPCRIILSQHGLSYNLPPATTTRLYSLHSFDAVCALTYASYRYERRRLDTYEPLVSILPNGVDIDRFRPLSEEEKGRLRIEWDLPRDKLIVLLLSRLVPKKGAHLILQSWPKVLKKIPNAFLWIVGGGNSSYELYIRRLVETLRVSDTVRIQGSVSYESTPGCYQASDLYLFPTLASEGMALTVLEAMSSGLACVISDHETARELYSDESVLFVADPNVEDAFVQPVTRLLKDGKTRRKIGSDAIAMIKGRFSLECWLAGLKEFYQRQLSLVGD